MQIQLAFFQIWFSGKKSIVYVLYIKIVKKLKKKIEKGSLKIGGDERNRL